jgi:hypothetical protein
MEELAKILPVLWKQHLRRVDSHLADILASVWPQVVGKPLAQCCRPLALEEGRLTLGVADFEMAAQLRPMAEEIRAAINSFLEGATVRKVIVKHVCSLKLDTRMSLRDRPAPLAPGSALPADSAPAGLDPEVARIVARSYAKYFARPGRIPHS